MRWACFELLFSSPSLKVLLVKLIIEDHEIPFEKIYQDFLNEFDSTWGVKGLIVTLSNSVITSKVRPHMGIISWSPLGSRWFARVGSFLVVEISICAKNRHYMKLNIGGSWTIKGRVCWHSPQTSGSKFHVELIIWCYNIENQYISLSWLYNVHIIAYAILCYYDSKK